MAWRKPLKRKKIDFIIFKSKKISYIQKQRDIGLKSTLNYQTPNYMSLKDVTVL